MAVDGPVDVEDGLVDAEVGLVDAEVGLVLVEVDCSPEPSCGVLVVGAWTCGSPEPSPEASSEPSPEASCGGTEVVGRCVEVVGECAEVVVGAMTGVCPEPSLSSAISRSWQSSPERIVK